MSGRPSAPSVVERCPVALLRRLTWPGTADTTAEAGAPLLAREWLLTNGLGGYASGTVSGVITRRYHGLLVAALPAPAGRTLMLNHVSEQIKLPDGRRVAIGGEERVGSAPELHGAKYLREFRLEAGLPVWQYDLDGWVLEKRLVLLHRQNTVHLTYTLVRGEGRLRIDLHPLVHFRHHEAPVSQPLQDAYAVTVIGDRYELSLAGQLALRLLVCGDGGSLTVRPHRVRQILYRVEESRGYESAGDLWSPGHLRVWVDGAAGATLVASTEPWDIIRALSPGDALTAEQHRRERLLLSAPSKAREGMAAELVLAADQFIIMPAGRVEDEARAHASGDEVRTVIAGYHWFTDWGRDTMISLEGLTLSTGRHREAGYILRTFAHYVRDGLIPNMFPDGENEGLYHTADATLWYFHAVERYVRATGDRATLRDLLPVLRGILDQHVRGTRFGIGVDRADGLLRQGAEGYQLTWMDAKVDGWVVTPRRGKAVEINALWYNALRLLAGWLTDEGDEAGARALEELAAQAHASFNARFWYGAGGYLYDVVDGEHGDDAACRPNQVLALSLTHPVLDPARWASALHIVEAKLLTPVGLRSLAPDHPDYKRNYQGDLRSRDAAYHQGTVWSWLAGPMVDAWLRVYPDDRVGARRVLAGFGAHLDDGCIGSVSEIFDAEPPFTPRGCVAQAWGVAELLRAWLRTSG